MRLLFPVALVALSLGVVSGAGGHAYAKFSSSKRSSASSLPNPGKTAAQKIYAKLTEKDAAKLGRSEKMVLLERSVSPLLQSSSGRLRGLAASLDDKSYEGMTSSLKEFIEGNASEAQRSRAAMMLAALHWTTDATEDTREAALTSAELDPAYPAPALLLGRVFDRLGKPEEAEEALRVAMKAVRRSKDNQLKSETLAAAEGLLGQIYASRADFPAADAAFTDCAQRYADMGDKEGRAFCMAGVGDVARRQGRYKQSEAALFYSFATYKSRGNAEGQAMALNGLGVLAEDNGSVKTAERYYRAALKKNQTAGRKEGEAANTANLGTLYFEQKRYAEAEQMYRTALEALAMLDAPGDAAFLYGNLALVARARGNYQEADSLHRNALALCKQAANPLCEAMQTKGLAETAALSGDKAKAMEEAQKASRLYGMLETPQRQEQREVDALLAKIPHGGGSAVPAPKVAAPAAEGAAPPIKNEAVAAPAPAAGAAGRLSPGEGMPPLRLPAPVAPKDDRTAKLSGTADRMRAEGLAAEMPKERFRLLGISSAFAAETPLAAAPAVALPEPGPVHEALQDGAPSSEAEALAVDDPEEGASIIFADGLQEDPDSAFGEQGVSERSLADIDEALWSDSLY